LIGQTLRVFLMIHGFLLSQGAVHSAPA